MFLRIDRLALELPMAEDPDPESAKVVQELFGGRFGEMSTLMNYDFQSWNVSNRICNLVDTPLIRGRPDGH